METLQINKLTDIECDNMLASLPLDAKRYLVEVMAELTSARRKHKEWKWDVVHRAAIVGEENGELTRAALHAHYESGEWNHMHHEAIQVASTAIRFLIETPYTKEAFDSQAKQAHCQHRYEETGTSHKRFFKCLLCQHETTD